MLKQLQLHSHPSSQSESHVVENVRCSLISFLKKKPKKKTHQLKLEKIISNNTDFKEIVQNFGNYIHLQRELNKIDINNLCLLMKVQPGDSHLNFA